MNNRYAFKVANLAKEYGEFSLAVPQLEFARGYILGLVGQNGAGKSTLLKMLMNLVYPDSGEVQVLGLQHPQDSIAIRQRIGYVSENPMFYEEATVEWMAHLVSRFYPSWSDRAYRHYLDRFNLSPKKKVKQLSKGMKVKLALLLALSHSPELLILDEPTSGIDPVQRRELLEEIVGVIQDEERTVIFSSHISQDIEQIADYIAILHEGQLVEMTDKEQLMDKWRRLSGSLPQSGHKLDQEILQVVQRGKDFVAVTDQYSDSLLRSLERAGAYSLQVSPLSLDGILMTIAGKDVAKCGH